VKNLRRIAKELGEDVDDAELAVGLHSLPGVGLVTWTILAVIWTIPGVINRCFLPYTLLGLHSLPGGVRLVT
jgi:hypothetical protein